MKTGSMTFEQERFQRWLGNVLRTSKRTVSVVAQEQFKGVIKNAFLLTPPMAETSFAKGFSAGKRAIRKDTGMAFRAISERTNLTKLKVKPMPYNEAKKWYQSLQKPNRRIEAPPKKRPILKANLLRLREQLMQMMGVTAAGWCVAADQLGVKYPAWIGRHKSQNSGSYEFVVTESKMKIAARNPSRHSASSYIQFILSNAFRKQAEAMRRRVMSALKSGRVDANAVNWGARS